MSAYGDKVREWLKGAIQDFGDRIPEGFPLHFAYSNSLSDDQLEFYAWQLYRDIKNHKNGNYSHVQQNSKPERIMYIIPNIADDGSVTFADRYTGRILAAAYKQANGLFAYYGTKDMIEVLFGRGGLDRMWVRTEDQNFFFDKRGKPKKSGE